MTESIWQRTITVWGGCGGVQADFDWNIFAPCWDYSNSEFLLCSFFGFSHLALTIIVGLTFIFFSSGVNLIVFSFVIFWCAVVEFLNCVQTAINYKNLELQSLHVFVCVFFFGSPMEASRRDSTGGPGIPSLTCDAGGGCVLVCVFRKDVLGRRLMANSCLHSSC